MTKAYSYLRFSTLEQRKGDSMRRQVEAAERYANENNLDLDKELTFRDLGVSAFRGANVETGRLGEFLDAVRTGRVAQGSYLLVESLDRISRQHAWDAQNVIGEIIRHGITIVTLVDRREYNTDILRKDPFAIFAILMVLIRANEESATKSMRLKEAYRRKRVLVAEEDKPSRPFTLHLPAWIRWNAGAKAFELIPEKAEIVRRIYDWADSGLGKYAIAVKLIEEGVKPFKNGDHWQRSYVHKLLRNPAVIGTFVPYSKESEENGRMIRRPLDEKKNYWPAAVQLDVYERVSARVLARAPKGRHSAAEGPSHLLAGIARCSLCGGSIVHVSKGKYRYLVCSRAHARAGCEYLAVKREDVEEALIADINQIIDDAPRGDATLGLEDEITDLLLEVENISSERDVLLDDFVQTRSPAIRDRIRENEQRAGRLLEEVAHLKDQRDLMASPHVAARLRDLREALVSSPTNLKRANLAIQAAVKEIVIDPKWGWMLFEWHHGSHQGEPLRFKSRHHRPFDNLEDALPSQF